MRNQCSSVRMPLVEMDERVILDEQLSFASIIVS